MEQNLNAGLLGHGLNFYLPQFKGLKSRLQGYVVVWRKSSFGPVCSKFCLAILKSFFGMVGL